MALITVIVGHEVSPELQLAALALVLGSGIVAEAVMAKRQPMTAE